MSAVRALDIYKAIDFQLRVESGPDAGRAFRIYPPQIIIGRDPKCDVTLNDPKTSRFQCKIVFAEHITITDSSRRKSTLVNGKKFIEHKLVPNDIISFGDTRIKFVAKSKQNLPSIQTGSGSAKIKRQPPRPKQPPRIAAPTPAKKNRTPLFIIIGFLAVAGGYLAMSPQSDNKTVETLTSSEEIDQQTEESRVYQLKLQNSYKEKLKTSRGEYQVAVQQHYIRGFRDFQAKNYGRAIQAFGSAIAKDPNHRRALRYRQLSEQLLEEQIDKHLFNGEEFKSKLMYGRCASEFKKVLILLNRPNNSKYLLAKERNNECLILQSGGSF